MEERQSGQLRLTEHQSESASKSMRAWTAIAFGNSAAAALAVMFTHACTQASDLNGSREAGTYFPSKTKTSGSVKACWDTANQDLDEWTLETLLPALSEKIYEEFYKRTNGVINPFPADKQTIPFCSDAPESKISISFFPFRTDEAASGDYGSGSFTAGAAFAHNCQKLTYRSEFLNPPEPDKSRITPIRSSDADRACVNIYYGALAFNYGSSQDRLKNKVAFALLHELLHAYGMAHEFLHTGFNKDVCSIHRDIIKDRADAQKNGLQKIGPYDPDSVMNYCTNTGKTWKTVQLSQGDVNSLLHVYGNPSSPHMPGDMTPRPPVADVAPPESSPPPTLNSASRPPFTVCREKGPTDFSSGWDTFYRVQLSETENEFGQVSVTAVSKGNRSEASWGTHPIERTGNGKFSLEYGEETDVPILIHRPDGLAELRIDLVCE